MTLESRLNKAFDEMMRYRESVGYATVTYKSSVPPFINFCINNSYTGKTCGKRYLPEVILPVYTRFLYCCGLRPQEPPAIRTEY